MWGRPGSAPETAVRTPRMGLPPVATRAPAAPMAARGPPIPARTAPCQRGTSRSCRPLRLQRRHLRRQLPWWDGLDPAGLASPCGSNNQPCCGNNCGSNFTCAGGTCVSCGGNNQPCCGASLWEQSHVHERHLPAGRQRLQLQRGWAVPERELRGRQVLQQRLHRGMPGVQHGHVPRSEQRWLRCRGEECPGWRMHALRKAAARSAVRTTVAPVVAAAAPTIAAPAVSTGTRGPTAA